MAAPTAPDGPATRLLVEYDGSRFAGWARQPGERSVQGELERALAVVNGAPAALTVAGRTDRGVHAEGQVCSYAGALPRRLRGVNALAGEDVAVLAAAPAPPGFSARHDARSRVYRYRVLARQSPPALDRGRVLWWPHRLEEAALDACAAVLPGRHEFTAFTPAQSGHRHFGRTVIAAFWRPAGDEHVLWLEADGFLRSMVRVLVATMLEVASGRRTVASFAALLDGGARADAGVTAPAHPLALAGVSYAEPLIAGGDVTDLAWRGWRSIDAGESRRA